MHPVAGLVGQMNERSLSGSLNAGVRVGNEGAKPSFQPLTILNLPDFTRSWSDPSRRNGFDRRPVGHAPFTWKVCRHAVYARLDPKADFPALTIAGDAGVITLGSLARQRRLRGRRRASASFAHPSPVQVAHL